MSDPKVLILNPATGAITAEPCPLLHYTIGLDAPAAFYCRLHGRYEAGGRLTVNPHARSGIALRGFARLLLAAGAPDCKARRRLRRGFEDEYKTAVRRAPLPARPVVSYTAITQAIATRAPLRACLSALAAYPDQTEQFGEGHVSRKPPETAMVTLNRTTGALGIASEPSVSIPTGETVQSDVFTHTRQPLIAPCAAHGWELVGLLPCVFNSWPWRQSLRDYAVTLIAAASHTCDEFAARITVLDQVKPPATTPPSTVSGYGPAWFLVYAKMCARAILMAATDCPDFTITALERLSG